MTLKEKIEYIKNKKHEAIYVQKYEIAVSLRKLERELSSDLAAALYRSNKWSKVSLKALKKDYEPGIDGVPYDNIYSGFEDSLVIEIIDEYKKLKG